MQKRHSCKLVNSTSVGFQKNKLLNSRSNWKTGNFRLKFPPTKRQVKKIPHSTGNSQRKISPFKNLQTGKMFSKKRRSVKPKLECIALAIWQSTIQNYGKLTKTDLYLKYSRRSLLEIHCQSG